MFTHKYFNCAGLLFLSQFFTLLSAETNIGADLVSRYVWRGTDYGNAAAVQPSIEYSMNGFTFGAWGSWALNGAAGGNENDLYASTTLGPVGLTLTDYFFPEFTGTDSLLNLDKHIIEASAFWDVGPVTVMAASNLSGDDDNSTYLELGYGPLSLGLGNGFYSTDGKFVPVSVGVSAGRDNLSVSFILNPDQETSFLVFGYSF